MPVGVRLLYIQQVSITWMEGERRVKEGVRNGREGARKGHGRAEGGAREERGMGYEGAMRADVG